VEIKVVKIRKEKFLYIEYTLEDGTTVTEEHGKVEVHPDLKNAFIGLRIHFAVLADYVKIKQVPNPVQFKEELVADFRVTGFSIGGSDDDFGVVLTGLKTTPSGKTVTINTPFTRFIEAEESAYKHIDELSEQIDTIKAEVELFKGGKKAPDPQTSMEFPETENE
jgi:hypothetical protein